MRALALAAIIGIGLISTGAAAAQTWTDPNGNIVIDAPRGWTVRPQPMTGGTAVLAFTPSSDCYFFGIPNPASASASVTAARHSTTPIPADAWVRAVQSIGDLASADASLISQSVDTSGFWPVQRAQIRAGERIVHAAIQARPGVELRALCTGSQDSYDALLNAMSHPNDAAWQAAAEQAPDETPAADQTPAPAQDSNQRPRRTRGLTTGDPGSAL